MKKTEEAINELKNIVKIKGLKYTNQRELVFRILLKSRKHLSAEEIHKEIKEQYSDSNVGIATVYRSLTFLEENDLISSVQFGQEGKKYENNIKAHHDHLICIKCGKIIEFVDECIEKRQKEIAKTNNFNCLYHTMQLYGICKKCQKKEEE